MKHAGAAAATARLARVSGAGVCGRSDVALFVRLFPVSSVSHTIAFTVLVQLHWLRQEAWQQLQLKFTLIISLTKIWTRPAAVRSIFFGRRRPPRFFLVRHCAGIAAQKKRRFPEQQQLQQLHSGAVLVLGEWHCVARQQACAITDSLVVFPSVPNDVRFPTVSELCTRLLPYASFSSFSPHEINETLHVWVGKVPSVILIMSIVLVGEETVRL